MDKWVRSFCKEDDIHPEDVWEHHRPTPPFPSRGKFVTTASVHLAVTLNVPEIPREGLQMRAQSALSSPGGGYVVAASVRAQGVETLVASPLGTGPNSHSIRRSLSYDGIQSFATAFVGDIGVGVTMVEGDGKAATVVATGVESEPSSEILNRLELDDGDIVHLDGADFSNPEGAEVLVNWAETLPKGVDLVLSVSPAVERVPAGVWMRILKRVDILTMNVREAATLTDLLSSAVPGTGFRHIMAEGAATVRRTGPLGCEVQQTLRGPRIQIPAYPTKPVDTTGVGDTHVGVMCASLLLGADLVESCRRANAAAALVLSHQTAYPLPSRKEVDEVVRRGGVPVRMQAEDIDPAG